MYAPQRPPQHFRKEMRRRSLFMRGFGKSSQNDLISKKRERLEFWCGMSKKQEGMLTALCGLFLMDTLKLGVDGTFGTRPDTVLLVISRKRLRRWLGVFVDAVLLLAAQYPSIF